MGKHYILRMILFFIPFSGFSQILINELSTSNLDSAFTEDESMEDWIELYNSGSSTVNLKDWALSDRLNNPGKWTFPEINILPGQYLLLFASGEIPSGSSHKHINFKLSSGETLFLSNSLGKFIDQYEIPPLQMNNSVGRKPDGSLNKCFFSSPTPGSTNNNSICYEGYEIPPIFNLGGGFYNETQSITITAQSPTSVVKYTLNGNIPKASDPTYNNQIIIDRTKIVSARSYSTVNKLPSFTVKNTYFINENISLPVISISTDSSNLWDWEKGIYVKGPNASSTYPYFGANFWEKWEKPIHIEFYDKKKVRQAGIDAGIRIHGGYSRGFAQKSLRIYFRGSYGTSSLDFPVINDKSHIKSYKRIILRNGGQDFYKTRFRDGLMQRLVKASHLDYMAYEPAVVFLNGKYWGLYGIRERHDKHYLSSNHKVSEEHIDLLEHKGILEVREGSDTGFINLHKWVMKANAVDPNFYNGVNRYLDIENFADFFIVQTFYSNSDWMGAQTGNMRLWRPQGIGGKWRYILVDLDFGLGLRDGTLPSANTLGLARNPSDKNKHSDIFNKMLFNAQFKHYFINRYADLMNTSLHIDNIKNMILDFKDTLEPEIPRHVARWSYGKSDWYKAIDFFTQFAEDRIGFARQHIQNEFALVKQVEVTLNAEPPGAGKIRISTIIPDSLPWKGIYFDGVPVTITAIPNQSYVFKFWETKVAALTDKENPSIQLNIGSDDNFTAFFDVATNVSEEGKETFHLSAAPNPASNDMLLTITNIADNGQELSLEIIDLMGKSIRRSIYNGDSQIILKNEDFSNGIYLVKLSNGKSVLTRKVIFN